MIIDMSIRLLSFIIYVFLINFFFSNWSSSLRLSLKSDLIILTLIGIIVLNSTLLPPNIEPFINILVTIVLVITLAQQHGIPFKKAAFFAVIFLTVDFICEALSVLVLENILPPKYGPKSFLFIIYYYDD